MTRFTDPQHTTIAAEVDGVTVLIPVDPANRHYREVILEAGISPAAYQPPPAPVPAVITARQLILGLLGDGRISEAEAEAWTQGTLPPAIDAAVLGLPDGQRVQARITLRAMGEAHRADALTAVLAAATGLDDAALDDAFRRWSAL